jgi:hypothetical protein
MIVFPLIRSVALKAATASSRGAILPMLHRPQNLLWLNPLVVWTLDPYDPQLRLPAQTVFDLIGGTRRAVPGFIFDVVEAFPAITPA